MTAALQREMGNLALVRDALVAIESRDIEPIAALLVVIHHIRLT